MIQKTIRTNENRLVVSVKQDNAQSLGVLYDKYAPAVLGVIKRIVNNDEQADEILHSTFIKAWEQLAVFTASKSSLFNRLINLARQTAFETIKAGQLKPAGLNNYVYEDKSNGLSNNASIEGQNSRSAFELLYYFGLSCVEAAAELNISVDELRAQLRMKIKKLR